MRRTGRQPARGLRGAGSTRCWTCATTRWSARARAAIRGGFHLVLDKLTLPPEAAKARIVAWKTEETERLLDMLASQSGQDRMVFARRLAAERDATAGGGPAHACGAEGPPAGADIHRPATLLEQKPWLMPPVVPVVPAAPPPVGSSGPDAVACPAGAGQGVGGKVTVFRQGCAGIGPSRQTVCRLRAAAGRRGRGGPASGCGARAGGDDRLRRAHRPGPDRRGGR